MRGTILGPLDGLKHIDGRPMISYANPYTIGHFGDGRCPMLVAVEQREGRAFFEVRNLYAGVIKLYVGDRRLKLKLTKPIDDLVIDLSKPQAVGLTRRVILRLVVPKGHPPPTGSANVDCRTEDGSSLHRDGPHRIENGQITLDADAPSTVTYWPTDVVGCWFSGNNVRVEPGDEPLVVDVPTVPAGVIYGRVLDLDGSPAGTNVVLRCHAVKKPSMAAKRIDLCSSLGVPVRHPEGDGRFRITPVPLGGEYVVTAAQGSRFQLSSTIKLNEAEPTQHIELRMGEGAALAGRAIGETGEPLADVPVTFLFGRSALSPIYSSITRTTPDGRFSVGNVCASAGQCFAQLDPRRDYQPTRVELRTDGRPTVVRLRRGLALAGRVVEDATDHPIPNAEVFARQVRQNRDRFVRIAAEARSDAQGRFRFSNLPEGALVLWLEGPNSVTGHSAVAGQPGSAELRAYLHPHSRLIAVPPADTGAVKRRN